MFYFQHVLLKQAWENLPTNKKKHIVTVRVESHINAYTEYFGWPFITAVIPRLDISKTLDKFLQMSFGYKTVNGNSTFKAFHARIGSYGYGRTYVSFKK